jgi:hypothetical protein
MRSPNIIQCNGGGAVSLETTDRKVGGVVNVDIFITEKRKLEL